MTQQPNGLEGELLDEQRALALNELLRVCGVSAEQVRAMVAEGMLHPRGDAPERWIFRGVEVVRVRRAVRLQRDLELNLPGTALALDLIEEIQQLRCRVHRLEQQLGGWTDADV
ncbi:MAG: chaperone modulator CbpM [Thiohalocapsa sp.]|jgi:chaperone modulatory protein CbpM|uniref:chaperone modulator CbpM n=1 Tax=Thiohalocapsa sp. TaxID=2497641 RepID=UPI0025F68658|nr:chaperone modulator CbpM [Thiohalocapsa sp.]MCG6940136.1 chaperone modulator CbpM [Thiohalocapsa sp.]